MKKNLFISFFIFAFFHIGNAQKPAIDSLKTLIGTGIADSSKTKLLTDLSWEYITIGDYKNAVEKTNEAISLSQKINYKKGLAQSFNMKGILYWFQGDYPNALDYQYKALKISEEIGDKQRIAGSLNNIGSIFHEQGDLQKALEDQLKALRIYEEIDAKYEIANLYNNIGVIYRKQNNYATALEYHTKALKIREDLKDLPAVAGSLNNVGVLQYEQGDYAESSLHFSKALVIFQQLGDKKNITNLYINIGNNLFKQKKYQDALINLEKSLLQAKEIGYLEGIKEAEKSLSDAYQAMNDNGLALVHYKNFVATRDSIFNETKSKQIAEMRTKYEVNQKEKEIELLTNEKKLKEIQLYAIIIGLLLIAVIVFVLYNRYHLKQKLVAEKQKIIIEKQLIEIEQRALLLQMNPHFIFNSLSSIGGLIYENKPPVAIKYLTMFSRLMRLILEYSLESAIPLSKEMELLKCYVELEQFRFEDKFDFKLTVDPKTPLETTIPPMLIQPHLENAVLHGLTNKDGKGTLELKIDYTDKALIIQVIDDGIGREKAKEFSKETAVHKSMATDITQKRLELINQNSNYPILLEIVDLKNAAGVAAGTVVKITISI
ncbi:MAG: tetratricopeptide repeat protein [Bacteroidota bacterium]